MKHAISVVIAVYNEEENVDILHKRITEVMRSIGKSYEIIFVDDGSTDLTFKKLSSIHAGDKSTKVVKLRRNCGQTMAWRAGFVKAQGDIIVTLDGDLQNDPKDIPRLLKKLDEGYDVVSGWRKKRKDAPGKKALSFMANIIRKHILFDGTHDAGCSLKAYRKEAAKSLELFGDLHRYATTVAHIKGYRVGEVVVEHHKRAYGKTKYGFTRVFKGLLDLFFLRFWSEYKTKPLHFFGFLGLMQYFLSFAIFVQQIIKALIKSKLLAGPLFIIAVLLIITGTIFIMIGLIAEMVIRVAYQKKEPYEISNVLE